jgi:hypothetical protein
MPTYAGARDWVDHFREAPAHNTIAIEGAPVVRTSGRLTWSYEAQRPDLAANLSDELWLARGRANWNGVCVERYLLCLPGRGLWVADWIQSSDPRNIHWYWHTPALTFATHQSKDRYTEARGDQVVLLTWASAALVGQLEGPQDGCPAAWHAPGYGELQPGQRVRHEVSAASELFVATYVGRDAGTRFDVLRRGVGLSCACEAEPEAINCESAAEIVWRVDVNGKPMSVAAGIDETMKLSGDPVVGVGGWKALQMAGALPWNVRC